jgi:hypothetical protein
MKSRKIKLLSLATLLSLSAFGQATQTVHLKPIHKQGISYYYNFKKVDGGAYGLQIPLQSLEDAEVDLRYKNFKTLRLIGTTAVFIPAIYLFSLPPSNNTTGARSFDPKTFLIVSFGSAAAIIGFEIGAKRQLNRAIDKYNTTIMKRNSIGLRLEPVQNSAVLGIGFSHTF